MAKYRKKSIIVDAFLWTGDWTQKEDPEWIIEAIKQKKVGFTSTPPRDMLIQTLEGTMRAKSGDYIIRGVKGEIYPCKPDIFEMTYEEVSNGK